MVKNKKKFLLFVSILVVIVTAGWATSAGWFQTTYAASDATVVTPNIPQAKFTEENGIKVFKLTAEEVNQEVSKGVFMKAWGYNGSTPGPTIVVHEGDTIRVDVTNNLKVPTSVHWHGLIVPNVMDGVPNVEPSPEIQPGKSFSYQFTVKQVGTFMYHSHVQPAQQEMMGLDGMFVSLAKNGQDQVNGKSVDRDYSILLQEWQLQKQGMTSSMNSMGAYSEGQVPPGTYDVNPEAMSWNVFTFNGKQFPSTAPMEVSKGQRVVVRLGNLSMQSHPIHLHGHNFKVVGKDGTPLPESAQYMANTINVGVGETYDVEFVADNPGTWVIHCHLPHHTAGLNGNEGGMLSVFHYQDSPWPSFFSNQNAMNPAPSAKEPSTTNSSMGNMKMGK